MFCMAHIVALLVGLLLDRTHLVEYMHAVEFCTKTVLSKVKIVPLNFKLV